MTKSKLTILMICRAAIIAALYTALTYAFGAMSFMPLQIRPAEALTLLPLFYPEAIAGLYVGCMLANLTSPFLLYDVFIGSLATLLAATLTFLVGRFIKNVPVRLILGGLFPVVCNALIIPLVLVLCGAAMSEYWLLALDVGGCEAVWAYGLGVPMYFFFDAMIKKRVKGFVPCSLLKKKRESEETNFTQNSAKRA